MFAIDAASTSSDAIELCQVALDVLYTRACLLRFTKLVHHILEESNVTISGVIDGFSGSVHRWFSVVNLKQLREDAQESWTADPSTPLLLLAMLLLGTLQDCHHEDHSRRRKLYTTLKKLMLALTSPSEAPEPHLVQVEALVALYECGQGMAHQAQLTLSSALAMVSLMESEESDILIWRKISLIVLDRIIMLSSVSNNVPSLCTLTSPICKSVQSYIQKNSDTASASTGTPPSQQLYKMAEVALATGRVLHYVYCLEKGWTIGVKFLKGIQAEVSSPDASNGTTVQGCARCTVLHGVKKP
ncbi:hypothetical protein B7463_g11943, partial [Scytalidium lignicola]